MPDRQPGGPLNTKASTFSLLRVARCRRDAIDCLCENTVDVIYRTHGSGDAVYGIHPGTAANAVEFVDAQFASVVVFHIGHVSLPFVPGGETIPAARGVRFSRGLSH
jgi:hypothetical protein